jgi:hypothetical protein
MARLEMFLEFHKDKPAPNAELVLRAATSGLRLLRSIETELRKGKPRRPRIRWQIDITTSYLGATIVYRSDDVEARAVTVARRELAP